MGTDQFRWVATNAPVAGSRTDDIWFVDENTGWAVNSDGKILRTDDGFETYEVQAHLKGNYLRCVAFADASLGWVGTLDREQDGKQLYRTGNGGKTWEEVPDLPQGSPGRICGLSVVNRDIVYAAGTNYPNEESAVLKTTDGGRSWTSIDMRAHAAILVDALFVSELEGWVVGGADVVKHPGREPDRDDVIATVLHTSDGGLTWQNVLEPIRKYLPRGEWGWKIQRVDDNVIVVALENFTDGAILRSEDGGSSWRRVPLNDRQRNANLEGIGFIDADVGWVGGWGDRDFKGGFTSATCDGGESWNDANEVGFRVNRFRFIGEPLKVGFASGQSVYRYTDAEVPLERELTEKTVVIVPTLVAEDALRLELDVPEGAGVLEVRVWEQFGRFLGVVHSEEQPVAGNRTIEWDWTAADGHEPSADAFLVRVTIDESSTSIAAIRESPR